MKLITEHSTNVELLIENKKNGGKDYFIEGIFMQADKENRNRRIYESKILVPAVDSYIEEQVSKNRAVGELNHPDGPTINLDKVSHKITDLKFEGSDVYGKAKILNTPMGLIAKGLMEGGVQLGVSSRGMGSLVSRNGKNYVGDNYRIGAVDIVQDPSAHNAFVNGIMEGVDWVYNNGILEKHMVDGHRSNVERILNHSSSVSTKKLEEAKLNAFKDFLNDITRNIK